MSAISPKMLLIHCLVGINHFAKFRKNQSVTVSSLLFSSLRGRQLLSCLALRPQIGPNALPLTNQKPNDKGVGLYPP